MYPLLKAPRHAIAAKALADLRSKNINYNKVKRKERTIIDYK